MTPDLPFAPPYKLKLDDTRWVEVQADGSQVATTAPVWPTAASSGHPAAAPSARPAAPARAKSAQAVAVLKVPFAEKDEAKALGARWDAAIKKWYVPAGVDPAPFARWTQD